MLYLVRNNVTGSIYTVGSKAVATEYAIKENQSTDSHPSFDLFSVSDSHPDVVTPVQKAIYLGTLGRRFGTDMFIWEL